MLEALGLTFDRPAAEKEVTSSGGHTGRDDHLFKGFIGIGGPPVHFAQQRALLYACGRSSCRKYSITGLG
jgi:hypothetical protein